MKQSQLQTTVELSVVPLSSPEHGELALINMEILRELLHKHSIHYSLGDAQDHIIEKIQACRTVEEYKKVLSYDLAILSIHDNLKAYDESLRIKNNS